MSTLQGLTIQITADASRAKREISNLEKELKDSAKTVKKLRDKLKELDDQGIGGEQVDKLVQQLEEAENQWYEISDAVDQYKAKLSDTKAEQDNIRDVKSLAAGFAAALVIVVKTVKALEEFTKSYAKVADYNGELEESSSKIQKNMDIIKGALVNDDLTQTMENLTDWIAKIATGIKGYSYQVKIATKDTNEWLQTLSEIEISAVDLNKYYQKLNKTVKKTLNLISGFDELNVYKSQQQSASGLDEKDRLDLQETLNDLKQQEYDIQKQIDEIWLKYAETLGITKDQYEQLWQAYRVNDIATFEKLCEEMGIDFVTAKLSMQNFAETGYTKITKLKTDLEDVRLKIQEIIQLMDSAGMDSGTAEFIASEKVEDNLRAKRSAAYSNAQLTGKDTAGKSASTGNYETDYIVQKELEEKERTGVTSGMFNSLWHGWKAEGGVFDAPSIVGVGEYGGASSNPEIVTPQNILEQTINASNGQLASVMAQVGQQIVAAVNNQNMEVKIGDDVIAQSAYRGNKAYYNRTGAYLL